MSFLDNKSSSLDEIFGKSTVEEVTSEGTATNDDDSADFLDFADQIVEESVKFKRKKLSVVQQKATVIAFGIAKTKKDPLYDKMMKARTAFRGFRGQLLKKYGAAGLQAAKKSH